jgi:outer membrane protein OmpA-like peptidoglycan-associated protein
MGDASPLVMDENTPFDVYQARNAVRIARAAGAPIYARSAMDKAEADLNLAEDNAAKTNPRIMAARASVQSAEDARLISVQRQAAAKLVLDQQLAQNQVDEANRQATLASAARADALQQAAKAKAGQEFALSQAAKANAGQALALSQAAKANVGQALALSQVKLSEADNESLRAKLLAQFNAVLQTRLTARGLIVNMSGMLFQTGKATLGPAAREKLAKIAGILSTHEGLMIEAEGFTDNVGGAGYNLRLSGQRAENARDYLVSQGVSVNSISSKGFGLENPIASNGSSAGRQENRRVELVVTGVGITAQTAPEK